MNLSLIEAKNEIAVQQGFNNWIDYKSFMKVTKTAPERVEVANNLVCELYAKSRAIAFRRWLENNAVMNRSDEQLYQAFLDSSI